MGRQGRRLIKSADSDDRFHFIDPPYIDTNMGHYGDYTRDDFTALLELLSSVKGKFILTMFPNHILSQYTEAFGWYSVKLCLKPSSKGGVKHEVITANFDFRGELQKII